MTFQFTRGSGLLIGIFAALNLGDLISTWVDLGAGLREGNPFMSMLLTRHGFGALIAYKTIVVTVVAIVMGSLWHARPKLVSATMIFCDLLVFVAVAANIIQYPG